MSKPLHKDISFWIVTLTLLGAADVVQIKFGLPWFANRLASMKPAPRVALSEGRSPTLAREQNPPHEKGDWRLPYFESSVLNDAPRIVAVLPSKFPQPTSFTPGGPRPPGGWGMNRDDRAIGVGMDTTYLLQTAYHANSPARMVLPPDFQHERYDFIANLPQGSFDALQKEIADKLGLTAEQKVVQTNVLLLVVNKPDLLKPYNPADNAAPAANNLRLPTIQILASFLEMNLNRPVLDQTGVTGQYDIELPQSALVPAPGSMPGDVSRRIQTIRSYLEDHLGLGLVETNAPVELLFVNKINKPEASRE